MKSVFSKSRVLLPLIHSGIALTLLSSLYLPEWSKWRARDVVEQKRIDADARAGRWPPNNTLVFEGCYFGSPRQISSMFPADLPSVLLAGFLVTPSNTRDRLLERAPGRILPSTRVLLFIAIFAAVVALQWYLMARVISTPQTSRFWRRFVYFVPIACIPVGLELRGKWDDLFRLASLPFWILMITVMALQYCTRKSFPEVRGNDPL